LPIYKENLVLHEIYDQEYDLGENPPNWCDPQYKHKLPLKKTVKRLEMAVKRGEDPKDLKWSIPALPKFSVKKGPLKFIELLWQS